MSPTPVVITYSAAVATAGAFTVPYEDPAIRNLGGGYVMPYPSYTLA